MKTAILFDLDGTLLDTLGDLQAAVNHTLSVFGYPNRSLDEIRRFVGNGAGRLIALSVPEQVDPAPVLAEFQRYYRDHCQVLTGPYPGIPEALEILKQEYPLAIVSNKPDAAVKTLCADYFPGIYARGESPDCPRKPAPDMVHAAMAALGVDTCLYVGDSEVDVITARNAGVPCLSVLWGFREKAELFSTGAESFCEDPRKLVEKIRELVGSSAFFSRSPNLTG